jgi:PAS domain S-box-containing protein
MYMANFNPNSFKIVKKDQWKELVDKIDVQTAEIAAATAFIKEIEKGNLESTNIENVDESSLTGSLVNMRNKMKEIAQEEAERNWITEGLAKFSDILRSNNNDLSTLANEIISELVKYMGTNQGGLYLINDNDKEDVYIELLAAYAYNRRKFIEQKIRLGQGILGQAALEKDTLVLTDIPSNYVKITSGLGEALPRNIVIVPLKLEERVYGLVEIASFQTIKKHQIQFVEKLSENLASTIASVRNTERTEKLLKDSQMQAEQLRSQEEEVRQNMEELAATQEEMQRVLSEVQKNEKAVNELINVSSDSILTLDRDCKVINFNQAFVSGLGSLNIQKGFNLMSIFPAHEQASRKQVYNRAFAGETFEMIDHSDVTGKESYFKVRHAPLYDIDGAINSIAIYASDITEMYNAKKIAEQSAEEARAQEEEIRQNMEELAATQEEMQRILHEVQKSEKEINELLNASTDSIMTIGLDYKLLRFNRVLVNSFPNLKIEKGFSVFDFFVTDEEKKNKKVLYDQAFAGKVTESLDHIHVGNLDLYFRVVH